MNRRTILTGTGIALSTTITGCLGGAGNTGGNSEEGENEQIEENSRVDEPPHEITSQDDKDSDDWNAEYLGEHIEREPSLAFEEVPVTRRVLADEQLPDPDDETEAYRIALVESERERDENLDIQEPAYSEKSRERLETVDFDESVLIVVESGYGSSSVEHRWKRVEEIEDGIHLHGYHTDPWAGDGDITTWVSVLEVERPSDDLTFARVSLTVGEDRRVHLNSTEGVVSLVR